MKNIIPYKLFESDDDIYTTVVDILADLTDDGFDIFGLDGISDRDYFRKFIDFNFEICKRRRDSVLSGYTYEEFELSEIKNSLNHLISYLNSKGFIYGVSIKTPDKKRDLIFTPMVKQIGASWKERKEAYESGYYDNMEIENIFLSFRKNTGGLNPSFGYHESMKDFLFLRQVEALDKVDDDMIEDILSEIRDENLSAKYQKDLDSHSPDICIKIFPGNHLFDAGAVDKSFKYDVVENSLKHLISYIQEFELEPNITIDYVNQGFKKDLLDVNSEYDDDFNDVYGIESIDEIDKDRDIRLIVIRFNKK